MATIISPRAGRQARLALPFAMLVATCQGQPGAVAGLPAGMKSYTQTIPGTEVSFDLVALPGGVFQMGSHADEIGHRPDEGPRHAVQLAPFWIAKFEVTWAEYELWAAKLDQSAATPAVDAVARPTPPYCDMTFGMGHDGYPAICMTQLAATTYCAWLSAKTGHHFRLPTEAEWEYACRAGTTTAYHFGDDPAALGDYAWFVDNADEEYHPVGKKKPNPWGLHDMHGNVAEWVQDQYRADFYATTADTTAVAPLAKPTKLYPRVARGGSWEDPAAVLRSAARMPSDPSWKEQDPQIPKSIWYHTDALFLGFRVVRQHVGTEPGSGTTNPPHKRGRPRP